MPPIGFALAALLATWTSAASAAALSDFKGHNVVAVMFAPGADDPRFTQETSELAKLTAQPDFQGVVVVGVADGTVIGVSDAPSDLRTRFGVPGDGFRLILLGKSGQVSLSQASVVTQDRIAQVIQAMPPP